MQRNTGSFKTPLQDLLNSPQWYPLEMDFKRRYVTFVRMSQAAYRDSAFLGARAARRHGEDAFQMRLDDLLLRATGVPAMAKPVHFILHGAYCCSTLLARYFELVPSTVVMKEPQWLTQLAMARNLGIVGWQELFDLSVRLLTRTYHPDQMAVIKTNIPCNPLGRRLLEQSGQATITFLMIPIRDFVLAVLKSELRRGRVRYWSQDICESPTDCPPPLTGIHPDRLTDEQTAACFWLQTRVICSQLLSSPHRSRILVLNGQRLANNPQDVVPAVMGLAGRNLTDEQLSCLLHHPSIRQHSKNASRPYDARSRSLDFEELENQYGKQADAAVQWAKSLSADSDWLTIPETANRHFALEHPLPA